MTGSILQVDRCKPIPGLYAFDHAPVRQHLEWEPVQGPVQESQSRIGRRPPPFLGTMPHLGWRDRLNCILARRTAISSRKTGAGLETGLENAAELGRSPGVLNRVAESNCAREPTRRAGQRKPRLQTPCKWLQWHNRHTRSGAANGSKAGWYRRPCVLTHPRRTP